MRAQVVELARPVESLVDAETVADYLGIGSRTVYELAAREEIPHRRMGRRVKFGLSEVQRWEEAKRRGPEV